MKHSNYIAAIAAIFLMGFAGGAEPTGVKEKLKELKEMQTEGLISQKEFDEKKAQLLDSMIPPATNPENRGSPSGHKLSGDMEQKQSRESEIERQSRELMEKRQALIKEINKFAINGKRKTEFFAEKTSVRWERPFDEDNTVHTYTQLGHEAVMNRRIGKYLCLWPEPHKLKVDVCSEEIRRVFHSNYTLYWIQVDGAVQKNFKEAAPFIMDFGGLGDPKAFHAHDGVVILFDDFLESGKYAKPLCALLQELFSTYAPQ
ncbi:MAG: hypothetical protein NTY53_08070 [Kiritimatiellaeota bacterium]|nr:hypothetical protein [Kiritimatiellota bacterium]